jgi:lauroyl/myristoyl acyltransferase
MVSIAKIYIAEFMRWFYWVPLRMIVQAVPHAVSHRLARFTGTLLYWTSGRKKHRLRQGLQFLFGDTYPRDAVRRTFINYALNSVEVFYYPSLTREKTAPLVEYEGMEHITDALTRGKGVILLHGHFGNEEFLMPAVAFTVRTRVNQLASRWEAPLRGSWIYRLPNAVRHYAFTMRIRYRESLPINFIYIDKGVRAAYSALRNNEILLLAGDGREGTSWTEADFLGRTALYSEGPMRMALKTEAAVLPVFIVRKPDNRHRLIIERPLQLERTADVQRDIQVATQRFVDLLGDYVRRYPCHYMKLFWQDMKYFKEYNR